MCAFLFLIFALLLGPLILQSTFLFSWICQDLFFFIKLQAWLLDQMRSMFSIVSLNLFLFLEGMLEVCPPFYHPGFVHIFSEVLQSILSSKANSVFCVLLKCLTWCFLA